MRKPRPIIKVCEDSPRIAFKVTTRGCDGVQLSGAATVVISKAGCVKDTVCVEKTSECGVTYMEHVPVPETELRYPSLGLTSEGDIEFYLDSKLFRWGAGRYNATLEIAGTTICIPFVIMVCDDSASITQVSIQENISGCQT